MLRVSYFYQEEESCFETENDQIIVGRLKLGTSPQPDLDLSPDLTASRIHARIWRDQNHQYWIEDLGSTHGTQVSGTEIKGSGRRKLQAGHIIHIGDTTLRVDIPLELSNADEFSEAGESREQDDDYSNHVIPLDAPSLEPLGRITEYLDANVVASAVMEAAATDATRRLALLYELLLECGTSNQLETLLQTIIKRVIEIIPDAARGALLLRGRDNDALLLKAYWPLSGPVVSETLARRAMKEHIGFIWQRDESEQVGNSIARQQIANGIYVPLLWKGVAVGVICVDNPRGSSRFSVEDLQREDKEGNSNYYWKGAQPDFSEDDLRLLVTIAQYLAMAIANQELQEELRRESAIKANLLRQFSPRVAARLMKPRGLELSGARSEVTILCSDIRGFTRLTADMEPLDVVQMLNDYFGCLIPVITAHDGTVDKYIGDAILAIFGGHEGGAERHAEQEAQRQAQQYEEAVRTALDMQEAIARLNEARSAQGKVICNIGIGVHCGVVLQGFIGVMDRMEFTVIGDAVNRASRYCDGAAPGEVLISPQVHQWIWKITDMEPTTIKTKHEGDLPAFRVLSVKDYE